MTRVRIADRDVGLGCPVFVIAEAGVNHNGDLKIAKHLVDVAATAGADAVKFQTFKAEHLVSPGSPKAKYQLRTTAHGESQYEMLRRLELSEEAHCDLAAYCQTKGILFLSTPFDVKSIDFLSTIGVAAYKVPSGEITNLPFLIHMARMNKPMIISTGMAYLSEVETAVRTIEATGNSAFVLLHCVSAYPASAVDVNLRAMQTMATAFGVATGYSDHTLGTEIALAAVALGACVVEKHFTLDRRLPGPDHQASLEPVELAAMVRGIRSVEAALGHGRKEPVASEMDTADVVRKSLIAAQDIAVGTVLTEELIAIKRPGTGFPPAMLSHLVGRTVRIPIHTGAVLSWEMLA